MVVKAKLKFKNPIGLACDAQGGQQDGDPKKVF